MSDSNNTPLQDRIELAKEQMNALPDWAKEGSFFAGGETRSDDDE